MLISRSFSRKLWRPRPPPRWRSPMSRIRHGDRLALRRAAARPRKRTVPRHPTPGTAAASHLRFTATAYCKGTTTASGVNVRTGIAAADPDLLPVGSVIQVDTPRRALRRHLHHHGHRSVVQGRHIDIYMWSCNEALALGPQRHRGQRPAPGMESAGEHAHADRSPVPAARSRPAAAAPPLPSRPIEIK